MSDVAQSAAGPRSDQVPGIDTRAARRFFGRSTQGADVLSREVERRMAERLELVRLDPARMLDAGSGDGEGSALLARRYPHAQCVALDAAHTVLVRSRAKAQAARSLLQRARDLVGRTGRVHAVCGDFSRLPFAPRRFQLAWSNLALAWAGDPLPAFRELCRVLEVGGLLMFSTYGPDTLKELREVFAPVDTAPHVHRFIDMHDLGDMLVAAGFAEPVMDMEVITLTYPDFDALLRDLRSSGQANVALDRRRGLMGRQAWQGVRERYESLRQAGRLPATVEVIYGHAWRPEPRLSEDGRNIIRMDLQARSHGAR